MEPHGLGVGMDQPSLVTGSRGCKDGMVIEPAFQHITEYTGLTWQRQTNDDNAVYKIHSGTVSLSAEWGD